MMTPGRARQIRNLFEAALELDTENRTAFLDEACRGDAELHDEVRRLLIAHGRSAGFLEPSDLPEMLRGDHDRLEGREIDRYAILREIGHGGMGSVYLAVRTDDLYRKPVALKVIRPEADGAETMERFRREREILAGLDHPGIARLLDGGTTPEGMPYLVMDYVEGKPIDAYCDDRRLSVTDRLILFRSVCAAVAYAHQQGVVHRDLKPSNVIVAADGTVKLLDFGIAKLMGPRAESTAAHLTRSGMRLMTPEYASPEQAKGESVTSASDMYSLGVMLYELLTGHRPYRMRGRVIHEVVRVICEEEPTRPSKVIGEIEEARRPEDGNEAAQTPQSVSRTRETTPRDLRRRLSGDLDNILLKALRKDPSARYQTAEAFGEDLRRHLHGLPVSARRSFLYRAGRSLYRRRAWGVAAVAVGVALATGAVTIRPWAALLGIAVLFVFGLRYREARSQFGHELAERELFGTAVLLLAVVIAGLAVGPFLATYRRLNVLVYSVGSLICAAYILRWPGRERWAGSLRVDLGRPRRRLQSVLLIVATCGVFGEGIASLLGLWAWDPARFARMVFLALSFAYYFVLAHRTEIREAGIVHYGRLLRWRRIASHSWKKPGGESLVLSLRVKSLLPWFTEVRVTVPESRKDEVETVLGERLGTWPSGRS